MLLLIYTFMQILFVSVFAPDTALTQKVLNFFFFDSFCIYFVTVRAHADYILAQNGSNLTG